MNDEIRRCQSGRREEYERLLRELRETHSTEIRTIVDSHRQSCDSEIADFKRQYEERIAFLEEELRKCRDKTDSNATLAAKEKEILVLTRRCEGIKADCERTKKAEIAAAVDEAVRAKKRECDEDIRRLEEELRKCREELERLRAECLRKSTNEPPVDDKLPQATREEEYWNSNNNNFSNNNNNNSATRPLPPLPPNNNSNTDTLPSPPTLPTPPPPPPPPSNNAPIERPAPPVVLNDPPVAEPPPPTGPNSIKPIETREIPKGIPIDSKTRKHILAGLGDSLTLASISSEKRKRWKELFNTIMTAYESGEPTEETLEAVREFLTIANVDNDFLRAVPKSVERFKEGITIENFSEYVKGLLDLFQKRYELKISPKGGTRKRKQKSQRNTRRV